MSVSEKAIVFTCDGEQLLGIVGMPSIAGTTGVLIVVGGPQYRVGSHRQFLLLSRAVAAAGYPVMRFDYRGMGDSSGDLRSFEEVDLDIATAIDAFIAASPGVERVVVWGLCDAASAALLYWDSTRDLRVGGLVLLNPWVRSEATLAKTQIKHYYGQRLLQAEFWRKLFSGKLGVAGALRGFLGSWMRARKTASNGSDVAFMPFQSRMMRTLQTFSGPSLLMLSGDDYTAKEFLEACQGDQQVLEALSRPQLTRIDVPDADHTFSSREQRQVVESATIAWLDQAFAP